MALVEVSRVWNLAEAQVAQSALSAAGFTTFVFDEHRANMLWTEQLAIGGIRLMAFESEADDAAALMRQARANPAFATELESSSWIFAIATLFTCSIFGWPVAGFKRPDYFHRITAAAACGATMLGFWLSAILRQRGFR